MLLIGILLATFLFQSRKRMTFTINLDLGFTFIK